MDLLPRGARAPDPRELGHQEVVVLLPHLGHGLTPCRLLDREHGREQEQGEQSEVADQGLEGGHGSKDFADLAGREDVQILVDNQNPQGRETAVGNGLVQVGLVQHLLVLGAYAEKQTYRVSYFCFHV